MVEVGNPHSMALGILKKTMLEDVYKLVRVLITLKKHRTYLPVRSSME